MPPTDVIIYCCAVYKHFPGFKGNGKTQPSSVFRRKRAGFDFSGLLFYVLSMPQNTEIVFKLIYSAILLYLLSCMAHKTLRVREKLKNKKNTKARRLLA